MIAIPKEPEVSEPTWQENFLQMLPMIKHQARLAFRHLDAEAQDDAIAEIVANCTCAYRRLHERGELERAFASALTNFAIRQFYSGRRVGTSACSSDVYSPQARSKGGYELLSIGAPAEQVGTWREMIIDNIRSRVPTQAAFRIDFPAWLESQTPRDKQIAEKLALSFSTGEIAKEFQISAARVSQLRGELANSWYAFVDGWDDESDEEADGDDCRNLSVCEGQQ